MCMHTYSNWSKTMRAMVSRDGPYSLSCNGIAFTTCMEPSTPSLHAYHKACMSYC